jgi:hypothetical protein
MTMNKEALLERIHERTEVLIQRTASTIHEALEEYLRERNVELARRAEAQRREPPPRA